MGQHTDTDPFAHVDAKQITGDYYFVNKFTKRWWYLAAALCLVAPPAGFFLLALFVSNGIHSEQNPPKVTAD